MLTSLPGVWSEIPLGECCYYNEPEAIALGTAGMESHDSLCCWRKEGETLPPRDPEACV